MSANRLGKGLRALIPDIPADETEERKSNILDIAVRNISPNPFQPREDFDEQALEELKQSIAEKGVIQPITVRRFNAGYQLIAGERRLRAVMALGLESIPAYIIHVESDEDMLEMSLIENIQREDLNPIDVAKGYRRLLDQCHLTQEQVAQKVGKDRSTVTNFLRLLRLPSQIQESLKSRQIDMGHARALITIENSEDQLNVWNKIVKEGLSVRKVESAVKNIKRPVSRGTPSQPNKPFAVIEAETKLQQMYGTKVVITVGKQGGKLEFEFYSNDDLTRILELLYTD
ncbi:ParB/RepB/Spo0J family partition protein [candidate division KSB1 bacterium]|nr:ParB/RepB/Spo0J family partition protein [candidate division KSB1 bacterium]